MPGTLYIVSTPIGNLEDITFRAVRILKEVGIIAAEDTRHTKQLCAHFGIGTTITSYHDFNKEEKAPVLLERLQSGASVALVSDAGTPVVSDPGYFLITRSIEAGIPIVPVPGPTAVLAALVWGHRTGGPAPGCLCGRFPQVRAFRDEHASLILFESPHRIEKLLMALREGLGNRRVALCRELTKHYEEYRRGTIEELLLDVRKRPPKGEITVVVEGQPRRRTSRLEEEESSTTDNEGGVDYSEA